MINFSSNNYLNLSNHPEVKESARRALVKYGLGSTGSRILNGTTELHEELESDIADFKNAESALVFTTGYMANVGVVSSVSGIGDAIILDEKVHASIIDGCALARAKFMSFRHNDMHSLENRLSKAKAANRSILIITDSVFSMGGDVASLPEIKGLAAAYGARLMIDEAHSTGVLGDTGRGIHEYFHLDDGADIEIGTLSKALGGLGGYVAGSSDLITYLKHSSRPFLFATSLPPAVIAGASTALRILREQPELVSKLQNNIRLLKTGLNQLGFDAGESNSAIIPIVIGEDGLVHKVAHFLEERDIFANPVIHPAVDRGKGIIRISMMSAHTDEDIEKTLDAFQFTKSFIGACGSNAPGQES